jgi:SAM-dependent MidA family methyltransferase
MMDRPEIDLNRPESWPASARDYLARHRTPPLHGALLREIRSEIEALGPISFARFMERALTDPAWGYYATAAERTGASGDFVTAPLTHPAFGALVGRRICTLWERMGRPEPFVVAEAGAGTGALAVQIMEEAGRRGVPLQYRLIEPFGVWRERQERELADWGGQVTWHQELEAQPVPPHLLLANELLDALPMHRVVRRQGGLRELYVAVDEAGELGEQEGPLSTVELDRYFLRLGVQPALDTPVEVSLAAEAWLRRALAATRGGWIWLLDYGAEADELYAAPRAGTLRAFHQHALSTDPFAHVGAQDLTADVDFTTLVRTAETQGWEVEEFTTQRDLLLSLGLLEGLRPPAAGEVPPAAGSTHGRWALLQLIEPHGMGAIRSLLLHDGRKSSP